MHAVCIVLWFNFVQFVAVTNQLHVKRRHDALMNLSAVHQHQGHTAYMENQLTPTNSIGYMYFYMLKTFTISVGILGITTYRTIVDLSVWF